MCQCERERFILERGEVGEIFCGECGREFVPQSPVPKRSKFSLEGCDIS